MSKLSHNQYNFTHHSQILEISLVHWLSNLVQLGLLLVVKLDQFLNQLLAPWQKHLNNTKMFTMIIIHMNNNKVTIQCLIPLKSTCFPIQDNQKLHLLHTSRFVDSKLFIFFSDLQKEIKVIVLSDSSHHYTEWAILKIVTPYKAVFVVHKSTNKQIYLPCCTIPHHTNMAIGSI